MLKLICFVFIIIIMIVININNSVWSAPTSNSLVNNRDPRQYRSNTCQCECGVIKRQIRVVGGEDAKPQEFPWIVGIGADGTFHCGGSLITHQHIITAAHCINGFERKKLRIVLGDYDRMAATRNNIIVERRVQDLRMHEEFDARTYNNDIAILQLDQPVEFNDYIQPVCLPQIETNYTNRIGIIAGWGRVEERKELSPVLKKLQVPIWPRQDCLDTGYQTKRITENMFCAGYPDGKRDACQGDSGGPLHVSNDNEAMEIVGLVSWGRGCGRPNFPGLYTKVNNYLKWIEETLDGECIC